MSKPGVSIVISCTSQKNIRQKLLASIALQAFQSNIEVIELESNRGPLRSEGWLKAKQDIVLFLDEDCELPHVQFLDQVVRVFEKQNDLKILGGAYRNPENPEFLTKAHNLICEAWIRQGFLSEQNQTGKKSADSTRPCVNLVGGFLAFAKNRIGELNPSDFGAFWGGEETFLLRELYKKGITPYFTENLSVIHHSQASWKKWLRRAWLQGYYRGKLNLKTDKANLSTAHAEGRSWIFKNSGLLELVPVSMHFAVMNVASSVGKMSSSRTQPHTQSRAN